jgi:hypothetical protein
MPTRIRHDLDRSWRTRRPSLLVWLALASGLVSLVTLGAALTYLVRAF